MIILPRGPARLPLILICAIALAGPAMAKDRAAAAVAQDPASWVTVDDYPAAALRARTEGVSSIRWDGTAEGKAENCTVVASSGSADLDQAACTAILSRARYTPALDKKGRPTRSAAQRRVRWQMPVDQPDTAVPYVLRPF